MNAHQLAQMIRESAGRFFRITFTKRTDGSLRSMLARIGVRKNLTGEGLKFDPRERDLMVVYELRNGYRMVNLRGLRSYRCGKRSWRTA